ncbi:hypothetical protein ACFWDI_27900 [Streptomyces sp. NPDC060064]|uniref:hypothetical protein n=1 Tax=Streptomyces sp. NPDC060064 TaxID=3347049 RepID=UPI00368B598E
MSTNSTPQPAATGRSGLCCCLLFTVLPVVWLLAAPFLPEQASWFPFWLAAVVWNGTDGQGGISHLLG